MRLRRAIDDARQVRLEYRDRTGAVTERTVDPLGLVAKAGVWYLIARDDVKGYRTFRAQRLIEVHVSARTFARPADFDLEAYWRTSVAEVERRPAFTYPVVLRVQPDALHEFGTYWEWAITARDAESATIRIVFPRRELAVAELVRFSSIIEIVSPPEVIAALIDYAQSIVRKYSAATPNDGSLAPIP